jgi:uncharacterized protein Smg (DUF494 family)
MVDSVANINSYCNGLYDFLGQLRVTEFKDGFDIIEKVMGFKNQNIDVSIINGEIVIK